MSKPVMKTKTLHQDLHQFCGSEEFYRHWIRSLIYTQGVQYLAENGGQNGAYWLIDAIASYQSSLKGKEWACFQVWHLTPDGKGGAYLTCHADIGELPVDLAARTAKLTKNPKINQHIEYTDFTFDGDQSFKLWAEQSGENQITLMLPSER